MSSPHLTDHHVEESIRIPELEKRENAKWLALLIDTEGSIGWRSRAIRRDRIDEGYRYEYIYRIPYVSANMDELESKETIDEGARLVEARPYTGIDRRTGKKMRRFYVAAGRALSAIGYMKPHMVKFRRLANLCLTLFKHHTYIPMERFDRVIEMLLGRYMTAKEVNSTLLRMTETEFQGFLRHAEELADQFLAN